MSFIEMLLILLYTNLTVIDIGSNDLNQTINDNEMFVTQKINWGGMIQERVRKCRYNISG